MLTYRPKRSRKRRCKLLLASVLAILCMVPAAKAAGTATITFNGKTEQFVFRSDDTTQNLQFFPELRTAAPGEKLTQQLLFTNTSSVSDSVALYVRAIPEGGQVPLSPIRGDQPMPEELRTFLAQMEMRIWNGDRIVYESGPDSDRDMTRPLYLGAFQKNEIDTLIAELTVPEYTDNLPQKYPLNWIFFVEPFSAAQRTVTKIWPDGNWAHEKDCVTVQLLKDGEKFDEAQLSPENNWTYTFEQLISTDPQSPSIWTVQEVGAEEGTVRYVTEGNITSIYPAEKLPSVMVPSDGVEIEEPGVPLGGGLEELTVRMAWQEEDKFRPMQTTVVLYHGDYPMDVAILDEENHWVHTWKELESNGNWRVLERNVPGGYAPTYTVENGVVIISNQLAENYPRQVNWSMAIIVGLGLPMAALGVFVLMRKHPHAEDE